MDNSQIIVDAFGIILNQQVLHPLRVKSYISCFEDEHSEAVSLARRKIDTFTSRHDYEINTINEMIDFLRLIDVNGDNKLTLTPKDFNDEQQVAENLLVRVFSKELRTQDASLPDGWLSGDIEGVYKTAEDIFSYFNINLKTGVDDIEYLVCDDGILHNVLSTNQVGFVIGEPKFPFEYKFIEAIMQGNLALDLEALVDSIKDKEDYSELVTIIQDFISKNEDCKIIDTPEKAFKYLEMHRNIDGVTKREGRLEPFASNEFQGSFLFWNKWNRDKQSFLERDLTELVRDIPEVNENGEISENSARTLWWITKEEAEERLRRL